MGWHDNLKWWQNFIPVEEKFNKVRSVLGNYFPKKWKWIRGTHIKVTDDRLLFYKKVVNKRDDKVASDGSFQIIVKNNLVTKFYIKRLLFMIDIIEHVNNVNERYERWKNEKRS